jgi:acyl carrier protein
MANLPHNPKSAEAIQAWLVSTLALLLEVKPHEIIINEPLAYYGLNSVEAITVSGDLSDWLGYELSPTIVWDYPTVAAIVEYLAQEM